VTILPPEAKALVVILSLYPVWSTYNTEFVTHASGHWYSSQHCCFSSAKRWLLLWEYILCTFSRSFENQKQVYIWGYLFRSHGKDITLIQACCPCHVTSSTNLVQLVTKMLF